MGIAELKEEDMPMVYLVLAEVFWRFSQMVVKKETARPLFNKVMRFSLYSRWESNPHVLRHWILNPTCLPIPPLEQFYWNAKL